MRDMLTAVINTASSLLGFGNSETIKRQYLGEGIAPQSVNTFEGIWTSSTDDENTLQDYREDLQDKDKPCPFAWLPVNYTDQGRVNTIMHEMILGSHDQFREFIKLFLNNDARRMTLLTTFIYGGIYLSGDHEAELADNRPIELAVNAMLNIENPAEERAEIRRNLGYLLAHFMQYEQESNQNNPRLLTVIQRFINGGAGQFPVSEEARDRCLYHISSIWADIHQQDPGNDRNIDDYRYEGQDQDFLTILRDTPQLGGIEVLQHLLPRNYEIPEDGSMPRDIERFLFANIRRSSDGDIADEDFRQILEFEAVKQCTNIESNNAELEFAISRGATGTTRALLDIDNIRGNVHDRDNQLLRYSVVLGRTEIVVELLKIEGVKNNAHVKNNEVFRLAVEGGYTEIVANLLLHEQVWNLAGANDNEALRCAAERGHTEIVEMLCGIPQVWKHANINHNEALNKAIKNGHDEIVEILNGIASVANEQANEWHEISGDSTPPRSVGDISGYGDSSVRPYTQPTRDKSEPRQGPRRGF